MRQLAYKCRLISALHRRQSFELIRPLKYRWIRPFSSSHFSNDAQLAFSRCLGQQNGDGRGPKSSKSLGVRSAGQAAPTYLPIPSDANLGIIVSSSSQWFSRVSARSSSTARSARSGAAHGSSWFRRTLLAAGRRGKTSTSDFGVPCRHERAISTVTCSVLTSCSPPSSIQSPVGVALRLA